MLRHLLAASAALLLAAAPAGAVTLDPTALLSVSTGTSGGNDWPLALGNAMGGEAITPDGRYVAFVDFSTNLTTKTDTNNAYDVFWRDTKTGETRLVSVNATGTAAAAGNSERPTISDDGRYVAFDSSAPDLVTGMTNANGSFADVFLRDVSAGTTILVSRSTTSATTTGNERSLFPVISGNGRYVVWGARASDLESPSIVSGTLSFFHILVRDLQTGVTRFVDVNPAGDQLSATTQGGGTEAGPNSIYSITPDGHYIAFVSEGYNLIAGYTSPGNGADNVFRRDLLTSTTVLASPSVAGPATGADDSNGFGLLPISADGRYIAFEGGADDLLPGLPTGTNHIFQRDIAAATTTLVDNSSPGTASDGNSYNPRMSADGRYVLFYTNSTNAVAGDANNQPDLVRWDRSTNQKLAVDVAAGTATPANGAVTFDGALSADGTRVAFVSDATNLIAGYTGTDSQVYLRDIGAGTTQLLSAADGSSTAGANAASAKPWLSAGGTRATWTSTATNLITSFTDLNGAGTPGFFTRSETPPVPAPEVIPPVDGGGGDGGGGTPPASTTPPASGENPLVPPARTPETTGAPRPHGVSRRGTRKRDVLVGTAYADTLMGLDGDDSLKGLGGPDTLLGGPGDDRIDAADGVRDIVDCGPGRHDRATVDKRDKVKGCEKVTRR